MAQYAIYRSEITVDKCYTDDYFSLEINFLRLHISISKLKQVIPGANFEKQRLRYNNKRDS